MMTDELPFPPGSAPPTPIYDGPLRASVAKFRTLVDTRVQEQIETTWDAWLTHLATDPANDYAGQMEHGGWSPVRYDPPTRSKDHARAAYALVLDYDKNADFGRVVALWSSAFGLVYTTKSHGVNGDRARVILPLERAVNADEYGKLWEWAARRSRDANLVADGQAKDISRFWYDPSTPPGGWRAERLTGEVIAPDPIIALAPEPPRLRAVPLPVIATADLRAERARRYLAKMPGAVDGDGGSVQTFNAVAAVMFGFDLDPDIAHSIIASDYNPRCDPPWSEKDLLHKIQSCAKLCKRPRGYLLHSDRVVVTTTQQAADNAPPLPEEHDVDWRTGCAYKSDGITFKRAYVNVLQFVRHHPEYRGRWSLNTMTGDVWHDGSPMRETLIHAIRARADHVLGFTASPADVQAAIASAAEQRPFNPIQQYFDGIDWDGIPRLSAMARNYLGSESPLHAEMVKRWMIGAAARALRPGCKLDTALMLFGRQGFFKSTFFSILGGEWHSDSAIDISNKDSFQQIHAAWIYEFSELENVVSGRAESRLKAFMTSTHDSFRAPYARAVSRKARSVALCGTTNRQEILTDDTGSRRFWIVPVAAEIPRETLVANRNQLWAEARACVESGEPWWFDRDLEDERELANVEFEDDDPWSEPIRSWIEMPSAPRQIAVSDLLRDAVKVDYAHQDRWAQMRAARVMKRLGWRRVRAATGDRRWSYVRSTT